MHLKCCSRGHASIYMQATCVHTQACTHMQAHVLTCVNCKTHRAQNQHMYILYMYTLHTCTKHGRQSRPPTRHQRHPHRKPTRLEPRWPAPHRPRCIAPSGDAPVATGYRALCRELRKIDAVWTNCTVPPDIASLVNGNRAVSLSDRQRPPLCLAIRFDVDNYVAR